MNKPIMTFEEQFRKKFEGFPSVSIDNAKESVTLKKLLKIAENQFITKFISLADKESLVLIADCLKNDKLYMSHPEQFNDILDTQLRLCNIDKEKLKHEFNLSEGKLEDYVNSFKHLYRILSFSLLDPLNCNASHMWGLYANKGDGLSIKYNLQSIISMIAKESKSNKVESPNKENLYDSSTKNLRFGCIQYESNYNPLTKFKEHIKEIIVNTKSSDNEEKWKNTEWVMYKHTQWQNEREVRIIQDFSEELENRSQHNWSVKNIYKDLSYLPMPKPEAIYVGWKVTKKVEQLICSIKELEQVQIYRLTGNIDYENYYYEVEHL